MREVDPDVVGLSVMTFQRGTARKIVALVRALKPGVDRRRRWIRPQPGLRRVRRSGVGRRRHRARRGRHHLPRTPARARSGTGFVERRGPVVSQRFDVRAQPRPAGEQPDRRGCRAAESGRPRARRLHLHRAADRRRRNLPRLHLRLQLLFDHRDARPELSHLVHRASAGRHRRRARARRARHLHRRRQHHAERLAVRGVVPRDRGRRLPRHRLPGAGDDVIHRGRAARRWRR